MTFAPGFGNATIRDIVANYTEEQKNNSLSSAKLQAIGQYYQGNEVVVLTLNGAYTDKTVDGFLAHEVETSCPQAVSGTKDAVKIETIADPETGKTIMNEDGTPKTETVIDPQEVDYSKLSTLTIAALQEALAKIETLEAKVAALEGS